MKEQFYVGVGTQQKFSVSIKPEEPLTMDDCDFVVEAWCYPRRVIEIDKAEAVREDAGNYSIIVDTALVGSGSLKMRVRIKVPDTDLAAGYRMEVVDVGEVGVIITNMQ